MIFCNVANISHSSCIIKVRRDKAVLFPIGGKAYGKVSPLKPRATLIEKDSPSVR